MTAARWAAGLATLTTAMLLQATLVGPLFVPLPASLPLVVIAAIAVLTGPSTGITLGFAGGLLVDLGSHHPIGILALTWLGVGLTAGVLGGMVSPLEDQATSSRRRSRRATRSSSQRATQRELAADRRRSQALLVGALGAAGAAATAVALAVVNASSDPLGLALARCLPAALLDAILALLVLPALAAALRSASLRPPVALGPSSAPDRWIDVRADAR